MTAQSWGLLALFLAVTLLLVKPLGLYMAHVMEGEPIAGLGLGARLESRLYRLCGIDPAAQMGWKQYALALLVFNTLGALLLYALQRLQGGLPLNPQHFGPPPADSAFNTALSFVTNTNWQSYTPETTMSYLTQMAGLAVQNFLSAATGIVVAVALIRGLARHSAKTIGNFWVDVTRATLYVLLPIATLIALALVSQGVIQNFSHYQRVTLLQPVTYQQPQLNGAGQPLTTAAGVPVLQTLTARTQTLPMGPVASQEAIKELGTNGGGFFNANSAHPFENPNAWTNLLEMLAIVLIPAALTYTFGFMVADTRQGWAVLAAMVILFVGLYAVCNHSEQRGNPQLTALGVNQLPNSEQSGGNMEGKEVRFGIAGSTLFATVSTVTSTGAVNSMHDSYLPLGGMVPLLDMMLGEVVFGGVGSGLYSMLIFAIIGVFIAGLMIGRTPEYLGKKIEAFEMKMSAIAILVMPFIVLTGTAIAVSVAAGRAGVANPGPHGFSEILYAFTSAGNNNGSAFAGISADTPFYNTALGIVVWLGRFWPIVAVLAVAGSLAAKKRIPVSTGTMPTHGPTFIALLIGTVLLVGALTFVPALALGPIVEHLMLWSH
ncbi:MAG: potassium-transporting ATPase subunit KdpA [Pseudomonadota bacterium]|jgi:K+-transporting ATPase ATPase A chain|nr:potassium-transporting ATPase subunit KdpA [Pseudomonadota bacterium]